jgi:hypothetical protein
MRTLNLLSIRYKYGGLPTLTERIMCEKLLVDYTAYSAMTPSRLLNKAL